MMYLIILLAVLIPLISKYKSAGLKISMLLLFIMWGLQYQMVNDWPGNFERWDIIVRTRAFDVYEGARQIEPLYVLLVKATKSFGFFGWLILCGVFELVCIYLFTKKYVLNQFYWLTIFVLMIRINYGLLFINSNRQSCALFLTLLGSYILLNYTDKYPIKHLPLKGLPFRIAIFTLIVILASLIHKSAILVLIFIPIYLLLNKVNCSKTIVILLFNMLFFGRFFFDFSNAAFFISSLGGDYINGFQGYLKEFSDENTEFPLVTNVIYFILMNCMLFSYNRYEKSIKFIYMMSILGIILQGFMTATLARTTQYFYIYLIFAVPYIVEYLNGLRYTYIQRFRKPFYAVLILYCVYAFVSGVQHEYYHHWNDFTTILSAPSWK